MSLQYCLPFINVCWMCSVGHRHRACRFWTVCSSPRVIIRPSLLLIVETNPPVSLLWHFRFPATRQKFGLISFSGSSRIGQQSYQDDASVSAPLIRLLYRPSFLTAARGKWLPTFPSSSLHKDRLIDSTPLNSIAPFLSRTDYIQPLPHARGETHRWGQMGNERGHGHC
jgi:hypothetical protein